MVVVAGTGGGLAALPWSAEEGEGDGREDAREKMVPRVGEKEWLRAPRVKEIGWMEQRAVHGPYATGANRGAGFFF